MEMLPVPDTVVVWEGLPDTLRVMELQKEEEGDLVPLREGAPLKDMERVTVGEVVLVGCTLTEIDPVLAHEGVPAPPKLPVEDRHKDTVGELVRVDEVEKLKLGVPLSTELGDLDREGEPEALGQ